MNHLRQLLLNPFYHSTLPLQCLPVGYNSLNTFYSLAVYVNAPSLIPCSFLPLSRQCAVKIHLN